jgi:hypothetical protein
MHALTRKLFFGCATLLPLAAALSPALHAQSSLADGPPNVLVVHREYLKPGKGGQIHERSESAFVKAFADAKADYPYFALDSLSGPSRSLFLFGYESFAAWEKATAGTRGNKTLSAKLDQASLMDGDLLSSYDGIALALRPDLSLNKGSIDGARYFEITTFVVKPGHRHDFDELAHMYIEANKKVAPETHWDCFETIYGNPALSGAGGTVFVVINTVKSLAETDKSIIDSAKVSDALGAAGAQKAGELEAASVVTVTTNLFAINPRESNPYSDWVKKDPTFWKGQ